MVMDNICPPAGNLLIRFEGPVKQDNGCEVPAAGPGTQYSLNITNYPL